MAHAFGLVYLPPYVAEQDASNPFQWYWGSDKGNVWSGAQAMLGALYQRIHLAGPDLTAAKMKPGALPSKPAGGQFSGAVLTPAVGTDEDGNQIIDATLGWWSGDTVGFDPATRAEGAGVYMYLDGGKRYNPGSFPKKVKGLFDKAVKTTVFGFDTRPADEPSAPDYPCEGCPSSGATTRGLEHRRDLGDGDTAQGTRTAGRLRLASPCWETDSVQGDGFDGARASGRAR